MILFFRTPTKSVIATEVSQELASEDIQKLSWLYGEATVENEENLKGCFIGPRREMITPWSTNAVEITQNMGLTGVLRIEEYFPVKDENAEYDPMLQRMYKGLNQEIFTVNIKPQPIVHIENLEEYNEKEGLALSREEMDYLLKVEKDLGRKLTDSEVFGFAQINSEHCRHKIFGGTFIIDGQEMESSLFQMIKKTTAENPNKIISAYKDNVAFAEGPIVEQFSPADHSTSDYFIIKDIKTVISLKAETHNFPTTVEPFNGASTGTGGEIRDRMGGGKGSWPIAGTAVYMTSYPRTDEGREWEDILPVRQWLYQTPEQILIKASNGASDFGNKFGQPLICGSVLTFEHQENGEKYAYDKVIMLAGGVGYGTQRDCLKGHPEKGNKVVVMGGDNYRIGLGGGSVSSVETGRYSSGIELNAVQRANAEMQKRAYNVVRALCEEDNNPIVSIHDHGSAGHVNCLSELVEENGGLIHMDKLPIGDQTLSAKEIIANESQERMGLLIDESAIEHVQKIADRERAPMYTVGETTGDARFAFEQADFIKNYLGPKFREAGLSTGIVVFDHNCDRPDYALAVYNDPEAAKYVTGAAFHHYRGDLSAMSYVHEARPDKEIYFTEQMTTERPGQRQIAIAPAVERLIVGIMRNWSRNVVLWNLAADPLNDPHTDNGGCSMCQGALTIDKDSVSRNLAYYVIAHASKFVRPGSVRIASTAPGDRSVSICEDEQRPNVFRTNVTEHAGVAANVAFRTPDGRIVLVAANDSWSRRSIRIQYNGRFAELELEPGAAGTFVWDE